MVYQTGPSIFHQTDIIDVDGISDMETVVIYYRYPPITMVMTGGWFVKLFYPHYWHYGYVILAFMEP